MLNRLSAHALLDVARRGHPLPVSAVTQLAAHVTCSACHKGPEACETRSSLSPAAISLV